MADVWANSVACHPRATCHTLQGAATWRIQCHDSRATCHIAECCHRANSMACHPRATLQGAWTMITLQSAVTWRNQCHDRATLQGVRIPSAILKIVFRHILFLSASLYVSKRGAYWDVVTSLVVGWLVVTRVHCGQTVHPRPIVTM